jgi:alpha-beta hydrolase superfamily lysophospholipase
MPDTIRIGDLLLDAATPAKPSRPPLLMVHGIMGGAWYFAKWLEFFSARGHPAYALNLRGHHGSRQVRDFGRVSVMDYVTDALDAAHGVSERHPEAPLILVGHSMGGLIAQKAAESLDVAGLVLLSPVPPRGILLISWPLIRRQTKHVGAMLRSRAILVDPADAAVLFLNRLDPVELVSLIPRWEPASGRAGRDITLGRVAVDASRIRSPVLVIAGADDVAIRPRVQRAIARKYGATFRIYQGNAHFLIWEPGWDRIAADVAAWIDQDPGSVPLRRGDIERPLGDIGHAERRTTPTSHGA